MQNEFKTPQGREVQIRIESGVISLYWVDAIQHQNNWIEHQMELGHDIDEQDMSVSAFYWILKRDWIADKTNRLDRQDNFHTHMKNKTWFTDEMYQWINKNV